MSAVNGALTATKILFLILVSHHKTKMELYELLIYIHIIMITMTK